MTIDSTVLWIIVGVAFLLLVLSLLRRNRSPEIDRDRIMEQTRQVAEDAARDAARHGAQEAQEAAVRAYQRQQEELRAEQASRRRDAAARAKETKAQRIASLEQWRDTFVFFVRALAKPFFDEWDLDLEILDEWSRERANFYISKQPYVLDIIRAVHADAQRAAESFANTAQKSPREIARERAKSAGRAPARNSECPYCGTVLDERAHLDHIRPVQKGGPSVDWNMVYACVPCNRAKRDLPLAEFVEGDYARRVGLRLTEIVKRLRALGKEVDILR